MAFKEVWPCYRLARFLVSLNNSCTYFLNLGFIFKESFIKLCMVAIYIMSTLHLSWTLYKVFKNTYVCRNYVWNRCAVSEFGEGGIDIGNDTYDGWNPENLSEYIPPGIHGGLDSCHLINTDTNATEKCDKWVYDTQYYKSSRGMEVSH